MSMEHGVTSWATVMLCMRVWLERCRDGRFAVSALRCDVWVVCACLLMCIVACFVGFWGSVFGGIASLHDQFWHFLKSAFSGSLVYSGLTFLDSIVFKEKTFQG